MDNTNKPPSRFIREEEFSQSPTPPPPPPAAQSPADVPPATAPPHRRFPGIQYDPEEGHIRRANRASEVTTLSEIPYVPIPSYYPSRPSNTIGLDRWGNVTAPPEQHAWEQFARSTLDTTTVLDDKQAEQLARYEREVDRLVRDSKSGEGIPGGLRFASDRKTLWWTGPGRVGQTGELKALRKQKERERKEEEEVKRAAGRRGGNDDEDEDDEHADHVSRLFAKERLRRKEREEAAAAAAAPPPPYFSFPSTAAADTTGNAARTTAGPDAGFGFPLLPPAITAGSTPESDVSMLDEQDTDYSEEDVVERLWREGKKKARAKARLEAEAKGKGKGRRRMS